LQYVLVPNAFVILIKLVTTIWKVEALAELGSHISELECTALSGLFVCTVVKEPTWI
jgi:hypothetical protein